MNTNEVFKLFSCCKIVKGYSRSIIYDLQRCVYYFIPNFIADILIVNDGKSSIIEIKKKYGKDINLFIDDLFKFLFNQELIFNCQINEVHCFPEIEFSYENPYLIENFILDINNSSNHDYQLIFKFLSEFNLKVLQLRFFYVFDLKYIKQILQMISDSEIRTIEFIIKYNPNIHQDELLCLFNNFTKLTSITVYNSIELKLLYHKQAILIYTNEDVNSHINCGQISKELFTCNLKFYSESQKINTCLNCKASIDVLGNIKNCPSMIKSFGNYKENSLYEIIQKEEFRKFWKLKKDDIDVCKDCEFRYMCSDCRAYIKDINNINSQPEKCMYNPYIAKFEGEAGYISVETYKI